jgi:CheY-like chemotaxis protein
MPETKGHVLYCEDHDDTRVLMTLLLEREGFRVTTACNGGDCLKLAAGQSFDLYLLDNAFPDASGVEVCEELRRRDAATPILFYSGRAMPREREAAMRAGASEYLIKPLDPFAVAEYAARWIKAGRTAVGE